MKTIVISAVNLIEGGALTILQNCLETLSHYSVSKEFEIVAVVHKKELCLYPNITYVEIPWAKNNWINRIYCEYVYFYYLSKKLKPYLWFSLHDVTPNVIAPIRCVYCHNSIMFHKVSLRGLKYNYKEFLFSRFYKYLYQISIKKNTYVVVQQNWIRDEFVKLYALCKDSIIVSLPYYKKIDVNFDNSVGKEPFVFFYPAYPRTFKNFEVICNACEILEKENVSKFKVILTLRGDENKYAKYVFQKYSHLKNIVFEGLLPLNKVYELYKTADCLVFPSKLETWGLPISEFSPSNKPMLIADLPYARETAAGSSKVCFFNPNNPIELSVVMKELMNHNLSKFNSVPILDIDAPKTTSWEMLLDYILEQ